MSGRTLIWQRRLDGDANGDEVNNINSNNIQDDACKKGQWRQKNGDGPEHTTMIIIISSHSLFRSMCYCLCLMFVAAAAVETTTKDATPSHGVGGAAKPGVIR